MHFFQLTFCNHRSDLKIVCLSLIMSHTFKASNWECQNKLCRSSAATSDCNTHAMNPGNIFVDTFLASTPVKLQLSASAMRADTTYPQIDLLINIYVNPS